MVERGNQRGRGRGQRGRGQQGRGGSRGGSTQSQRGGRGSSAPIRPLSLTTEKRSVLDFKAYYNQRVLVKFQNDREAQGILKGYDSLVNLVLQDAIELFQDGSSRQLGTVVCRGTAVMLILPAQGYEQIDNPFLQEEDDEEEESLENQEQDQTEVVMA